MKRVAIIGGGIAGIAAACKLQEHSSAFEVSIFESQPRLGGVLETVQDGPYLIERSADNFATLLPQALELSRSHAADVDLIQPEESNRQAFVLHEGTPEPIPLGFSLMQPTRLMSILTTRALTVRGKLRLLGEYWVKRRESEEDESLESFATRRLGREAFESLVEPIVSGIFTADPATLSMAATMPQFLKMERDSGGLIRGYLSSKRKDAAAAARKASGARYDQFMAPKHGMSAWIEALARNLPTERTYLNTTVQSVTVDSQGEWTLCSGDSVHKADGVVFALPAAPCARLWEPTSTEIARLLDEVPYASSAVAALVVKKSDLAGRTDGFGLVVPRKEGRASLALSYSSNKYSGRVPDDEILIRVFFGGAKDPKFLEQSDEEILSLAKSELRDVLQWQAHSTQWERIIRWPNAMPQYLVGHVDRMQTLSQLMKAYPTAQLCGAAYQGVGIPQCVRSGTTAAQALVEYFHAGT